MVPGAGFEPARPLVGQRALESSPRVCRFRHPGQRFKEQIAFQRGSYPRSHTPWNSGLC